MKRLDIETWEHDNNHFNEYVDTQRRLFKKAALKYVGLYDHKNADKIFDHVYNGRFGKYGNSSERLSLTVDYLKKLKLLFLGE